MPTDRLTRFISILYQRIIKFIIAILLQYLIYNL